MSKGLRIQQKLDVRDWRFGGISGIERTILRGDGNWKPHRPKYENQHWTYGDTKACVTFSALNCLEYMYHNKLGKEVNFSDRFTAKMSGTTYSGNYLTKVGASIQNHGVLFEDEYEFDGGREARNDWDDYYSEIPSELQNLALTRLDGYETFYEWVDLKDLKTALQYSPIQIGIKYASKSEAIDGVIPRKEGRAGHAVTLEWIDDDGNFHIFDHYQGNEVKVLAHDYDIQFAMAHYINKKVIKKPMINLDNNTLVQLVEGKGGFGLALNGKIIVDDLEKVLATWLVRNNGDTKGKVRALNQADWDSFDKLNLKKEAL